MSEILSVEGQLVGIPVEKYTGVSGVVVDPVNKTIGLSNNPDIAVSMDNFSSRANSNTVSSVITAEAATGFVYKVMAIKLGPLVFLSILFDPMQLPSIPSNTDTYMFTLASKYKPIAKCAVPFNWNNTSATGGVITIDTDGKVYIRQQGTGNGNARNFFAAYVTNN